MTSYGAHADNATAKTKRKTVAAGVAGACIVEFVLVCIGI